MIRPVTILDNAASRDDPPIMRNIESCLWCAPGVSGTSGQARGVVLATPVRARRICKREMWAYVGHRHLNNECSILMLAFACVLQNLSKTQAWCSPPAHIERQAPPSTGCQSLSSSVILSFTGRHSDIYCAGGAAQQLHAAQLAAERKRLASLNRFFACVPHGR